jgi:DNA-binding SARP family transcriptional activator
MEYRILGPLEVRVGAETLLLGPQKQRALLAVLLLEGGKTVSRDRLIDDLWGEAAPDTAAKTIQNFVSRLRKLLPAGTILTRAPGYAIAPAPGELDLTRFEHFVAEGRESFASGELEGASTLFRQALSLWRGPPLAEFESAPFARSERPRLEELRLVTVEQWLDAELALGHHAQLVGELESLVGRHPLREGLCGRLMLALYRSNRQAEALGIYQDARRRLVKDLGIEPSATLRNLERAILRQDSSLALAEPSRAAALTDADSFAEPGEARPRTVTRHARRLGTTTLHEGTDAFVGRAAETARLEAALRKALDGAGQLVMLVGEPGIGKTRMAVEFAVSAEQLGAWVYWGRCHEREGAPPYWPWVEALRSYVRECDPEQLRSELGAGASEVAEVIADVRERLPDLAPRRRVDDPRQARFRLFVLLARFLQNAARNRPLVLVLDDLHWADDDSLALLEFLSLELATARLLVIGTYRDLEISRRHPLSETLAELTREQRLERIHLAGLSQDEVARCIEATSAIVPSTALAEAVHSRTEGNPLFVTEVVRLLMREGELTPERLESQPRSRMPVPEGIREVIGKRLGRLSGRCNAALTIAALIGGEFKLEQVGKLMGGVSEEELLELLEEALSGRVIEEVTATPDRYQFTHALIQETLAQELSLSRRVRLQGRIAEALEDLYGAEAEAHAAELAHHFHEAETVLGPEKLVRYSAVAGEQALEAHSPEQALAHFDRALAALGAEVPDGETARLLFGLARAQLAALEPHELEQAAITMRRAFDHYLRAGDVDGAIAVAAHPLPYSVGMRQTEIPQLLGDALSLVPDESHAAGRVLASHGWFSGIAEGDYARADTALQRALSIAQRHDDLELERRTLANASWVDAWHFRWQDGIEKGLRAIELARRASDGYTAIVAHRCVAWATAAIGEREQARSHTDNALAVAERLGERWWRASASFDSARLSVYEGDWESARRMSDISLTAQSQDPRGLAMRALLEYELGNFDTGAAYAAQLQELVGTVAPPGPIAEHYFFACLVPLVGQIAPVAGKNEGAKAAAERLLSMTPQAAPALAMTARTGLALIAVQQGDTKAAERLYAALKPQHGIASMVVPLTIDRVLGMLAATSGHLDTAMGHFEEGLNFCERAGYRPEYAWTASDYAEALLLRNGSGDRESASILQGNALRVANQLGMRPLAHTFSPTERFPTGRSDPAGPAEYPLSGDRAGGK